MGHNTRNIIPKVGKIDKRGISKFEQKRAKILITELTVLLNRSTDSLNNINQRSFIGALTAE